MTLYFVFGTHHEFVSFCRKHELSPRDPTVVHLTRVEQFQGRTFQESDEFEYGRTHTSTPAEEAAMLRELAARRARKAQP